MSYAKKIPKKNYVFILYFRPSRNTNILNLNLKVTDWKTMLGTLKNVLPIL